MGFIHRFGRIVISALLLVFLVNNMSNAQEIGLQLHSFRDPFCQGRSRNHGEGAEDGDQGS
jgi:hypothetical protein